ncbi:MAG: hypothetical protein C0608_00210 [Deltaproteobacteria bacterium]|nr:MAG: hypothetical protein C0608_00210 [Deltaproteobacteria bacterium]
MRRVTILTTLFIALILTGCAATGKRAEEPAPELPLTLTLPDHFGTDSAADEVLHEGWWLRWNDPVLNALIEEAVESNLDLKLAAARIRDARISLELAHADLLPSVSASASAGRSRNNNLDKIVNSYSASLNLSWQVDLWESIASRERAALYDLEKLREENVRAYRSIVASVVKSYVAMRSAAEQVTLAEEMISNDEERLEVVRARFEAGLAPSSDVYMEEQTLSETRARLHIYKAEKRIARHAINTLVGRYPTTSIGESIELSLPSPVSVGLPSSLLSERADVRAALNAVKAQAWRVSASEADLMPSFTISASAGVNGENLSDLFDWERRFWNILGNLLYPIFNGDKLNKAVTKAQVLEEQAVISYGKTILSAMKEVEDALITESEQFNRLNALTESAELAKLSLEITQDRYSRGLTTIIPSLNARRALYSVESSKLDAKKTILINRASLHLALGGDFGHEVKRAGDAPENNNE